jgi:acetyltransferase-like isoleucine patch superfamily enzyme
LRKDHRPYFIKKAHLHFQKIYVKHFLRPHFESLGKNFVFMRPWHVKIFGSPIELGDCTTIIAASDNKVRLTIWSEQKDEGRIRIGDYCMICPGVRISSASEIIIGDSCMIASGAYITDCDWHGIYNRVSLGKRMPVRIEENVWIGDSAIVCKGVTIGVNSIVGAGAVVVNSVPPNVVVAGNPARVVKPLDSDETFTTRAQWFSDPSGLFEAFDAWDKALLRDNTLLGWLRSIIAP